MFGFTIEEMQGKSRRRPLVTARQIGMYVFRELTDLAIPAIAREFGGRDHTTVIHAVDEDRRADEGAAQIYDQVDRAQPVGPEAGLERDALHRRHDRCGQAGGQPCGARGRAVDGVEVVHGHPPASLGTTVRHWGQTIGRLVPVLTSADARSSTIHSPYYCH